MLNICTSFKTLFIVTLCSIVMFPVYVNADKGDTLVVTTEGSRLRSQASTKSVILDNLTLGDKLNELQREGPWIQVITDQGGIQGWMYSSNVALHAQAKAATALIEKTPDLSGPVLKLSDLGYTDGILFEGSAANHARKLYFQVPQDVAMNRGLLRIHYRFSPLLEKHSNMRIYVNKSPRKIVRLGGDSSGGWLDVSLPASDLQKRFVEVEIRSAMLLSNDRCFDERTGGAYLQVLSDTTLQWQLQGEVSSIRTFWQLLPANVSVSLPEGEVSEETFRTALGVTQLLKRSGREVTFSRLPVIGDVVIASSAKLRSALSTKYPQSAVDKVQVSENKNLVLVSMADTQFLSVAEEHNSHSLDFLSDKWRDLASSDAYQIQASVKKGVLAEDNYALSLQKLGMNTDVVEMSSQASWSVNINPSQLPPGHRPDKVRLQLITAPSMSDKPVMFYSYLNGVLLKAVRMVDTGRNDEIVLNLPTHLLSRVNNLRFVAQRDLSNTLNNCAGEPMQFPIQVKPDSTLVTVLNDTVPTDFAALPGYLSAGYDAYLPKQYLSQPENVLDYLATLTADMDLPTQVGTLRFYTADEAIAPQAPFILLGKANVSFSKQGVRFDKGRIDVVNQNDEILLAIDALPKVSIAQVVRLANIYGLWVLPPDPSQLGRVKDMHMSKDNVAFADRNGVLMTLDSTQPGLSRVDYPDTASWFELFGEYRFWYFAVGWLLLTSLIVYLYRLSRSHRKN